MVAGGKGGGPSLNGQSTTCRKKGFLRCARNDGRKTFSINCRRNQHSAKDGFHAPQIFLCMVRHDGPCDHQRRHARYFAYKQKTGDLAAHQISTVVLIILLAGYFSFLTRIWPIKSATQAWIIGGIWFLMTEVFEIGMGLIAGASWSKLFHAYNVFAGQVWIFIPLWVLVGPYVFFRHVRPENKT